MDSMTRVLLETPATFGVTMQAALAMDEPELSGTLADAVERAGDYAAAELAVALGAGQPYMLIHSHSGRDTLQPHVHIDVETNLARNVLVEAATVAHSKFQQRLQELCADAHLIVRRGLARPHGWELGPQEHEQYASPRQPCPESLSSEIAPLLRLNRGLAQSA